MTSAAHETVSETAATARDSACMASSHTTSSSHIDSKGADLLLSLAATVTEHAATAAANGTEAGDSGDCNNNPITPSPPAMGGEANDNNNNHHNQAPSLPPQEEMVADRTRAITSFSNDERQVVMSLHSVRNKLYTSPIKVSAKSRLSSSSSSSVTTGDHEGRHHCMVLSPPDMSLDFGGSGGAAHHQQEFYSSGAAAGKRNFECGGDESSFASRNVRARLSSGGEDEGGQEHNNDKATTGDRVISPTSSNEGHHRQKAVEDDSPDKEEEQQQQEQEKHDNSSTMPPPYHVLPPHYPPNGYGYPPYHNMYHQGGYYGAHPPPPPPYYHPHHHPPAGMSGNNNNNNGMHHMTPSPPPMYPAHPYMYPYPPEAAPQPMVRPATAISTMKVKQNKQPMEQEGEEQNPSSASSYSSPANGGPPSANRCATRKHLFPPNNWQDQISKADEIGIPDFHRLVNFPDYLTRGRSGGMGSAHQQANADMNGKKHCVMCGKVRVCSSSGGGLSGGGRGSAAKRVAGNNNEEDDTAHIIPRQNKGVCTACDVAVWVVLDAQGLEIKWCKGCKNFRPWPCFGEKVLATKCVRCRDRQREKYAAQKRCNNSNRKDDNDVLAATGLANMINAASTNGTVEI